MNYFKNHEHVMELFEKIIPVAEKNRVVFLVVKDQLERKSLFSDLCTLFRGQPNTINQQRFSIRVHGNKNMKSTTTNVIINNPEKIKGIKEEQIIYL